MANATVDTSNPFPVNLTEQLPEGSNVIGQVTWPEVDMGDDFSNSVKGTAVKDIIGGFIPFAR